MSSSADIIEPNWILVFCKNPGRWWVRLLAWGRYHHVKAIAHLPKMRGWLIYDVKFNGTRVMLAHEDDPGTSTFLRDYLDNTDTIAMPRLPVPRRRFPQLGFWCTIAVKHLVGIRSRALRPDRLWHDCIAAGGKPCQGPIVGRSFLVRARRARIKLLRAATRVTVPVPRAVPTDTIAARLPALKRKKDPSAPAGLRGNSSSCGRSRRTPIPSSHTLHCSIW